MVFVGVGVHNFSDTKSPNRVFSALNGNLVEFRQPAPRAAGTWVNHGSPAPTVCIGLPGVALIDNSNPARQLRVFFPDTDGHLRAARFPAGANSPVFDDHTTAVAPQTPPLISTSPGALIVESTIGKLSAPTGRGIRFGSLVVPVETFRMYMGSTAGTLVEHKITGSSLAWTDLGLPGAGLGGPTSTVLQRPGAPYFAFPNPKATAGVFVTAANGSVFEFVLHGTSASTWVAHGSPGGGVSIQSEPHALMVGADGSVSSFYAASDSNMYQLKAATTGTAGSWIAHGQPADAFGITYDLTTSAGAQMVVPFPGDIFVRFFIVGNSNPIPDPKTHITGVPEDRVFERSGNSALATFVWTDHGPSGVLPMSPNETIFAPRGMGQNTNGSAFPETVFVGTAADRLLEYDVRTDTWIDHMSPPLTAPCGPRQFSVGFGG